MFIFAFQIQQTVCSSINEDKNGNVLLKILAKPGAKLNSITGM